ncbi:MAG: hypothetical protein ACXW39_08525 [Nitrospira sp.]
MIRKSLLHHPDRLFMTLSQADGSNWRGIGRHALRDAKPAARPEADTASGFIFVPSGGLAATARNDASAYKNVVYQTARLPEVAACPPDDNQKPFMTCLDVFLGRGWYCRYSYRKLDGGSIFVKHLQGDETAVE